ncbi:unnamed protein product, partial [Pleuronectes platessa]
IARRNTAVPSHHPCRGTRWKASWDLNKSAANDKTDLISHFGSGEETIFGAENGNGRCVFLLKLNKIIYHCSKAMTVHQETLPPFMVRPLDHHHSGGGTEVRCLLHFALFACDPSAPQFECSPPKLPH